MVDVVEPWEGQPDLRDPGRRPQRQVRAGHAAQHDALGSDLWSRPLAPAVRAAVAAQVPHVDRLVRVGVAAAAAVLGVGRVLELGQRDGVVLHAEVGDPLPVATEVGYERVVGAQHEVREPVALGCEIRPAIGDRLELSVAVELVAEEVAEDQHARLELAGDWHEPSLIHLEQAELARPPPRFEQSRGHPPAHVGARAVSHHGATVALDRRGEHRSGRRLPVRRRDQHRAPLEPLPEVSDRVTVQPQEHPAGGCRAPAPCAAYERPHQPGDGHGEGAHQEAGTRTRSACRATRTWTGSSPIGSPSA